MPIASSLVLFTCYASRNYERAGRAAAARARRAEAAATFKAREEARAAELDTRRSAGLQAA